MWRLLLIVLLMPASSIAAQIADLELCIGLKEDTERLECYDGVASQIYNSDPRNTKRVYPQNTEISAAEFMALTKLVSDLTSGCEIEIKLDAERSDCQLLPEYIKRYHAGLTFFSGREEVFISELKAAGHSYREFQRKARSINASLRVINLYTEAGR